MPGIRLQSNGSTQLPHFISALRSLLETDVAALTGCFYSQSCCDFQFSHLQNGQNNGTYCSITVGKQAETSRSEPGCMGVDVRYYCYEKGDLVLTGSEKSGRSRKGHS